MFFFSSYFGDKEKIFLFLNLDKPFKLIFIFFLLSKDRVISSSFNEEIRAKCPPSKKQILFSSPRELVCSLFSNSTNSNSSSSIISVKVLKSLGSGFEYKISCINPSETCLL